MIHSSSVARAPRKVTVFQLVFMTYAVTGAALTCLCGIRFAQLAGAASLVQSLCYLLIYAALFKLRGRPSLADRPGFRIPLGTAGLCAMVAPSVFIVLVIVRQGLFPDGRLDLHQALIDLALFGSGPLIYLLARLLLVRREVPA